MVFCWGSVAWVFEAGALFLVFSSPSGSGEALLVFFRFLVLLYGFWVWVFSGYRSLGLEIPVFGCFVDWVSGGLCQLLGALGFSWFGFGVALVLQNHTM